MHHFPRQLMSEEEFRQMPAKSYETTARVEGQGRVELVGVPFAPGTEVEVSITPTRNGTDSPDAVHSNRAAQLFAALDKARNTETIGPLRRAAIYDRNILH
jgi:hypothetical protein